MNDVLIAEISGRRPGGVKERPTERFQTKYDKVIVSNDSEGYETDWEIINVPEDYRQWYIDNIKNSENMFYAQMNRSYAIKYAREHGYKYLVQLDDNIQILEIATRVECDGGYSKIFRENKATELLDDFIKMFVCVLDNTNAAMVGCNLASGTVPNNDFLLERYVYSVFCLNLETCPDVFHGDFEDDIEYRLKCGQMGLPVVQIVPLRYGKVSQRATGDLTGCRAEYTRVGLQRGEHMRKLYGDMYNCALSNKAHSTGTKKEAGTYIFKHRLKPFKVGVFVFDMEKIESCMLDIFKKYAQDDKDKFILKERKIKQK